MSSRTPRRRRQGPSTSRSAWVYVAPAALLGAVTAIMMILSSTGVLGHTADGGPPASPSAGPVQTLSVPATAPPPAAAAQSRRLPVKTQVHDLDEGRDHGRDDDERVDHPVDDRHDEHDRHDDDHDDHDGERRSARQVDGQDGRHAVVDRDAVPDERQGTRAPQPERRPGGAPGRPAKLLVR